LTIVWKDLISMIYLIMVANLLQSPKINPDDVYILLIVKSLHEDTFISIKSSITSNYNFVPIELSGLVTILETSLLAFSLRHSEVIKLFNKIKKINRSNSKDDFIVYIENTVIRW
ncbi:MAG: hypothetical protein ACFFCD_14800, partial [Promethearchaeota archaeon]